MTSECAALIEIAWTGLIIARRSLRDLDLIHRWHRLYIEREAGYAGAFAALRLRDMDRAREFARRASNARLSIIEIDGLMSGALAHRFVFDDSS